MSSENQKPFIEPHSDIWWHSTSCGGCCCMYRPAVDPRTDSGWNGLSAVLAEVIALQRRCLFCSKCACIHIRISEMSVDNASRVSIWMKENERAKEPICDRHARCIWDACKKEIVRRSDDPSVVVVALSTRVFSPWVALPAHCVSESSFPPSLVGSTAPSELKLDCTKFSWFQSLLSCGVDE